MVYKVEVFLTEDGYGFLHDIVEETGDVNSVAVEKALELYLQDLKNKKSAKEWIFNRFRRL